MYYKFKSNSNSLHQMLKSWTSVSQWTGILPLSQSLWTLKREREECSGGGWSAVWGVGRVECCELSVGSHVGHGKVNSSCYHNSNCFDNSETTATMHRYNVTYAWLRAIICLQCRHTNLHRSWIKRSCLHGNDSLLYHRHFHGYDVTVHVIRVTQGNVGSTLKVPLAISLRFTQSWFTSCSSWTLAVESHSTKVGQRSSAATISLARSA